MQKIFSFRETFRLLSLSIATLTALTACSTQRYVTIEPSPLPPSVILESENETSYYSEWQALVSRLQKLWTESN